MADPRLVRLRVELYTAAQSLTGEDLAEFRQLIDEIVVVLGAVHGVGKDPAAAPLEIDQERFLGETSKPAPALSKADDDRLADLIWWLIGYLEGKGGDPYLGAHHIDTLRRARVALAAGKEDRHAQ